MLINGGLCLVEPLLSVDWCMGESCDACRSLNGKRIDGTEAAFIELVSVGTDFGEGSFPLRAWGIPRVAPKPDEFSVIKDKLALFVDRLLNMHVI